MEKITESIRDRLITDSLSGVQNVEHIKGLEQPGRMAAATFLALHELLHPVVGTMASVLGALVNLRKKLTVEETTEIARLLKAAPYVFVAGKGAVDRKVAATIERKAQRTGRNDHGVTRKAKPASEASDLSASEVRLIKARLAESEANQDGSNPDIETFSMDQLRVQMLIDGRGVPFKLSEQYAADLRQPEQMTKSTHLALDRAYLHQLSLPEDRQSKLTMDAISRFLGKSPWVMVKGTGIISRAELEAQTASYEEASRDLEQILEQQELFEGVQTVAVSEEVAA